MFIEGWAKREELTGKTDGKNYLIVKKSIAPSIPAIVVTVKMKCWVGFHITT